MQSITTPVYAVLRALGGTALARSLGRGGLVLCYHNVVADCHQSAVGEPSLHLPVEAFRTQVEWLATRYRVVPLSQFVQLVAQGASLRRVTTITFDDAYTGVLTNALPVLEEVGLPATLFIVSKAPDQRQAFWWDHLGVGRAATHARRERWLRGLRGDRDSILAELRIEDHGSLPAEYLPADWNALKDAADAGIALGVHSATHRVLPRLTDSELEGELIESRSALQRCTGVAPDFFAYPYGLWDARVRNAVRAAGYQAAFTLDGGLVHAGADPWALPRVNVPATIGRGAFEAWCAGLNLRRFIRS